MYYLIYLLLFIIVILIFFILKQNKKYDTDILSKNKQISLAIDQCNYYMEECKTLREIIDVNKSLLDDLIPEPKNELEKEPIYAGKKALIGDYYKDSYTNTKRVLESLGFDVTVALSGKEVIKRFKDGEKYDIIFSNNIYRNGTGQECLKELKQIEDFNTPVIIHTLTEKKRDYFVNEIRIWWLYCKTCYKRKCEASFKKIIREINIYR